MDIELILPTEMSMEDLAVRLAGAAWGVLAGDPREREAYRGSFGQLTDAILERLNEMRTGEQAMGGIRTVHLACEESQSPDALEVGLTSAIAGRLKGLLSDLRAVQLVTHDLPESLGDVLRAYEWIDPVSPVRPMAHGM